MNHKRNPLRLINNAQAKRQKSFEKLEQGIQKLLKEQKPINFNSIAEASGLIRGWLYKESDVKVRIIQLREQSERNQKKPSKHKPSDTSKDSLIKTLRTRLKKVESENQGLKKQLEIVYGQMSFGKEQEKKINRLEAENASLKNRLYAPVSNDAPDLKVVSLDPLPGISERIKNELESLGINLTSTLAKKIQTRSEETVLTAIDALKEQIDLEIVRRPGAWLAKAVTDGWKPNEAIGGTNPKDAFEEWYELACKYEKVTRCRQDDHGNWLVQEITGEWHFYQEFSQKWTLEYLKRVIS